MMTSSNGNIFRVTDTLWIPFTKTSDVKLRCFLWCTPWQTVEQTVDMPVIWDAMVLTVMITAPRINESRDYSRSVECPHAQQIAMQRAITVTSYESRGALNQRQLGC